MTGDSASEFAIQVPQLAGEAAEARARSRGEMLGFTGLFLANFIERELRLMVLWRSRLKEAR